MTYFEKEKIKNKVQIWADGACSQQHGSVGGWGALIFEKNKEHQIYGGESLTTNNKMEILACIKALEFLSEKSIVTIYTDSKYLINGITMWIHGWKKSNWTTRSGESVKNRELWEKLDHLCKRNLVNWQWVRGHSGNRGNEIAEILGHKSLNMVQRYAHLSTQHKADVINSMAEKIFRN